MKALFASLVSFLTLPTVGTLIRAAFKGLGPLLIAKGWTDEAALEGAAGAVVTLVGIVWGVVEARKKAALPPAPQ
jgi:hypothetical protein